MATYAQRALAIIEGAIDAPPTVEQQQRIADRVIQYRPDILAQVAADPANPTPGEKAQVFVEAVRQWGQSWLRATAEKDAAADAQATIDAAGDAAAGDL